MEPRAREQQAEDSKGHERRLVFALVIAVVLIVALSIVDLFRGNDPNPKSERPDTPTVVVVPNPAIDTLPTEGDEQLVLKGAQEIDPGDFVTTEVGPNAKEGFLLKALSVEESDGQTTVDTKPASLFDAVPSGSLVANPSDFVPEPALATAELVEQIGPFEPPVPTEQPAHLVPAFFRRDAGLLDHLPHLKCKNRAKELELKPFFTPEFEPVFNVRWNDEKERWKKRIETADAGIRGELRAGVKGSARGTFDCIVEPALTIPLFTAVVPAGPVPVPLHVYATVEPTVDASVGSKMEGEINVGVDGFAGVEYGNRKLVPKGALVPKVGGLLPTLDSGASGSVGVTPRIKVVAGWKAPVLGELTASARISLPTKVKLSYEPLAESPLPKACLGLGVEGKVAFNLPPPVKWFSPKKSAKKNLLDKCRTFGGKDKEGKESAPPGAG